MARGKAFDPDWAVNQAMAVFWSNRYAHTTPRSLTDALGIGMGSLYNAFTSKHALFERALRHYFEQETSQLIELLEDVELPVRERLRQALALVADAAREDVLRRGCMITNTIVEFSGRDEEIERLVRWFLDRQEAAFRAALEEGKRSGEIPADCDADRVAAFFLATTNGIRVLAQADPEAKRLDGLVEVALTVV